LYFTCSDDVALSIRTATRRAPRRDMPFIENVKAPPIKVKSYNYQLNNVNMNNSKVKLKLMALHQFIVSKYLIRIY
jgi:hypothetical protein